MAFSGERAKFLYLKKNLYHIGKFKKYDPRILKKIYSAILAKHKIGRRFDQ